MNQPHCLASGETLAETDRWFRHVTVASIDETYLRFVFTGDLIDPQLNCELDPAIENVRWMNLNEIRSAELDLRNSREIVYPKMHPAVKIRP